MIVHSELNINLILTVSVTLSYSWRTHHKILCSKEIFQIFCANQSLRPRPFKFLPAFRSIVVHRYEGYFDLPHFSQLITRFRTAVISLVEILIVLEYDGALESRKKLKWSQPECLHQLKELNSIWCLAFFDNYTIDHDIDNKCKNHLLKAFLRLCFSDILQDHLEVILPIWIWNTAFHFVIVSILILHMNIGLYCHLDLEKKMELLSFSPHYFTNSESYLA